MIFAELDWILLERRSLKTFQKLIQILVSFCVNLGIECKFQICVQKSICQRSNVSEFPCLSFKDLELFWWPLGTVLGLRRLSWMALDPDNTENPAFVLKGLANAGFQYVETLDGPLAPILASLGPIWSQNGSQK